MTEPSGPRWRLRVATVFVICAASYVVLLVVLPGREGATRRWGFLPNARHGSHHTHHTHHSHHDDDDIQGSPQSAAFQSLSMTEAQCRTAFPGLTKPIDDQVAQGPFALPPATDLGPLLARVRNGRLVVLQAERPGILPPELLDARASALHQISRALLTAPFSDEMDASSSALDTVFALNVQDQPHGSAWTYSLPAFPAPTAGNAPIGRSFLMPHFAFWAWRPRFIGSMARAAAAVDRLEDDRATGTFAKKDPRAVWRGTARFGSAHHPDLRRNLLAATAGRPWADVQELAWLDEDRDGVVNQQAMQDASNALMIEDFCRYKYVVHTEGITYSGRFQFHQLCRSVVLTPPIAWMQHTTHLVKPLFSSDIDLDLDLDVTVDVDVDHDLGHNATRWQPTDDEEAAWPHARPNEANLVFVAPDWSDLGATVRWLEAHPAVAEGIAARQRSLFADRGYLSPAAEACYWRALLRGWRQVVQFNESALAEGVPWELYSLTPREDE
ncbi:Lipopolysaccharide-modifying protein [Niveomyces insectorum RCEF 264]|uniref:Lipopolysaccharide-modifying protein n=1 Tax=Niveomyces insectorum RCEF 264 TaxID=1081102 RepID=A0A167WEW8_9HYPO|nr:Lipopolysaccharide-modifying protein [Niveomyces insectorum RCEF 264]